MLMNEPRLNHVQCLDQKGLHRMAYWEWGDAANPRVLVCVHGLSRQGRDFDTLAHALRVHYRVVCPDVVGRGQSDWLAEPAGYEIPAYVADMVTLLARLNAGELHWLGTSMGGLIGLVLASFAQTPISKLIINDIGPTMPFDTVTNIGAYLGDPVRWRTVDEAADYLLAISPGFGPHTREQWLALTRPMLEPDASGQGFISHYDPKIAVPYRSVTPADVSAGEALLWHCYDAVHCPVLLLRGADSDLLTRETALAMTQRGFRARVHEFAGVGHAPTLVAPQQVQVVQEFLLAS